MALRGPDYRTRDHVSDAVRVSLHGAPEELRGLLGGMLAVRELGREDFAQRRYVLFSLKGAEVLTGACNYRISANGDLRVIEDGGKRSRYLRRRQWRALGQLGPGILRGLEFEPELLVVAVRPARRAA